MGRLRSEHFFFLLSCSHENRESAWSLPCSRNGGPDRPPSMYKWPFLAGTESKGYREYRYLYAWSII